MPYRIQNLKSSIRNRLGQSEMIGFALIIIIVAVLIVVFISLSANDTDDDAINNFEIESFIQASLEYTTSCVERGDYLPLRKVIFRCIENQPCSGGEDPCEILEEDYTEIVNSSWNACPDCLIRGYEFNITQVGDDGLPQTLFSMNPGNRTVFSKTAVQDFDSGVAVFFKVYYSE